MCLIGSGFSFYYADKYEELANHQEYNDLAIEISQINDIERLKAIALQLHENTVVDTQENSGLFFNLFEVFLAFVLLLIIALYLFHRETVSNNSLKRDSRPERPPAA